MIRVLEWKDFNDGQGPVLPVALSIGTFDSLHVGHQRLIGEVVNNTYGAIAAVCTFAGNPATLLGNRRFPGSILSLAQKIEKLAGLGIALVVLIDFSPEFSKLTGKSFLELLARRLDVKKLVVGYNFHMGKGRDTDPQKLVGILAESGTELEIVPATMYRQEAVSSSRIRELIRSGRFSEARDMLKDDFRIDLRDLPVQRRRSDSWVDRTEIGQVLPRPGEYQVRFITDSLEYPGSLTVEEDRIFWQKEFAEAETEIRFLAVD